MLILAVWLPGTAHCGLESLGVLPSWDCCEALPLATGPCEDGCKIVENSPLKTECLAVAPIPPELTVQLPELSSFPPPLLPERLRQFECLPIVRLPQFTVQTALPIRGPSSLS